MSLMSVNYETLFADVATRLGVPQTPELEAEVRRVVEDLAGSERPDAFISQGVLQQRARDAADEADRYIAGVGEDGNAAAWARTTAIQGAVFGSFSERIGNEATRMALDRLRSAHRHLTALEAHLSARKPLAATLSRRVDGEPKRPGPTNHRPEDDPDGTRWPDHAARETAQGRPVPPPSQAKAERLLAEWKPVIDFLRELLKKGNIADDTPIRDICTAIVAGDRVGLWRALQRLNQLGILFPGRDRNTQVIYWRSLLAVPEYLEIRAAVAADILSHLEHRRIDPSGLNRAELQQAVELFEQHRRAAEAKAATIRAAQVEAQARALWLANLERRLAQDGCLIEGNATQSLRLLLRSADQEPSGEKEELIADTIATVGWNPEMGRILRSFARHDTGEKIQLPKAYAFFNRHYGTLGRYRGVLEPMGVLSLLKTLVYPDTLRMSAFYDRIGFGTTGRRLPDDPVELPGYDDAVREVLTEVRRLRHEGHFTDDDLKPLPMSDPKAAIPIETLTPILEREYGRLFSRKNFRKRVEAAIYGYRYHDRLLHRGHPEYEDSNRATFQALYAVQVRGGQSSGTLEPVSVDEKSGTPKIIGDRQRKNEQWLYDMGGVGDRDIRGHPNQLDQNGNLGRFYFAIKWEYRKAFWKKLTVLMDKMALARIAFQAKISLNTEHADTGDAAVLYFRSAFGDHMFDQKFVYHALCRMMAECPEKWFYDETSRPILAAQVFDPKGKMVKGLSFMQDALEEESSANGVRAEAHATGIRNARLLRIIDAPVSAKLEKLLMANALITQAKIDPEFPAFNLASEVQPVAGHDLFGFIRSRTDQRDRPKTPGHAGPSPPPSSPLRAEIGGGDPVSGPVSGTIGTEKSSGHQTLDSRSWDLREAGMTRGLRVTRGRDDNPPATSDEQLAMKIIRLAVKRGLKKAAVVAARLSEKALANLADRNRLNKVLEKTGFAWAKGELGPWGRKIAATDLLLLGLAALARSDEEVAQALQRISGQPTDVAAPQGLPTGLTPVSIGRSTPSLVTLGR